ncbi:MAG TPA: class I adenylate-forming enzyme family protein, partial [Ilumatobacteraceae bacterium]|nr:class I adenylate-forming enzyme family protein [Ilumatobacteraceae bacterium]
EAIDQIDMVGGVLRDRYQVKRGDRVCIVSANSPDYLLAMWALVSLGAIISSLNGWWTGAEMAYGIELTEPRLILGDARRLTRIDADAVDPSVPVVDLADLVAEARHAGIPAEPPVADVQPDDPAVILFTSGTTGRPKGATLSHRNILNMGWATMLGGAILMLSAPAPTNPPAPSQPASLMISPMFHVSGMIGALLSGPVMGLKLVFPPPGRWDPAVHLELTQRHRLSTWTGVPTQFWRMLEHPDFDSYDVSSVTTVGSGGAPFPPELIRELGRVMPNAGVGNGYGMSETVGIGTVQRGPDMAVHPDSVGSAYPGVEVEIAGPNGERLGEGEVGEIYVRSASVFLGYWNNEAATRAAIDDQGWYHSGDFGRISDGRLYLESRMRDLILRGGENIYPMEIEHRLVEHPDILEAAVVGVDHRQLGQEVKAFVVRRPGAELAEADVQRWAAETLAGFKVPAYVVFLDELPTTESGKIMKHVLEAGQFG